jgi:hypothetical protein
MAFTVISNSFKDGDYLPNDFHPVSRFRLWLRRGQQVAAPSVVARPGRHEKLRRHLLRPRRANWLRLLALAGREHPSECERASRGRRQCRRQTTSVEACRCLQCSIARLSAKPTEK